jgi:ring-1,2-phenylacetyl-CoA epoxidase subunit PaaE
MDFFALKIADKRQETADTVTLEFALTPEQKDDFKYYAGQYLTFKLQIDGQEVRRAYSMSSAPLEGNLAISVKKVPGGRASNYLHDKIQVGDTLQVAKPEGRFIPMIQSEKKRTWYFFAAGSGITPIMSIIKTVLEEEPMSTVYLLYGSRTDADIIFKDKLNGMANLYAQQLHVEYVLSKPVKDGSALFGLIRKSNWAGKKGRITEEMVSDWLNENVPFGAETEAQYYICGPEGMAEAVKDALMRRGTHQKQVHTELFTSSEGIAAVATNGEGVAMKVIVKGITHDIVVPAKNTILDVLIGKNIEVPYSCTSGACSTCMARVKTGKVSMDACYALDDNEVAAGYILTCQAHPTTSDVSISFDE